MSLSIRAKLERFVARKPAGTRRRRLGWNQGGMGAVVAVATPALVAFGALAVDVSNKGYHQLLLHQAVQSAALAAGNRLSTYYSTGSASTLISAATSFAGLNMPPATFGTVVSTATVGTWNGAAFNSGGSAPNAVQVTGTNTVPLYFGGIYGVPTVNLTSTVVASYSGGYTYNTIVIDDLSKSFAGEVSQQRAVDTAILNCVGSAGTSSQFGITGITGHATILQPLAQASSVLSTLLTFIEGLQSCGNLLMPACSGSNVAAGIYSAIQQFKGTASSVKKNVVIITDGAPNAERGVTYTTADGVTCGSSCTDADMETGAQTQAAAAQAAGINITTIYYSGDDTNPTDQAAYKTFLASLVTGSGVALVVPNTASLSAAFGGCPTMPSVLKTVM